MSYLLDLVRLSLDDVSIEKISGHIGQDPITTTEAIDSALPMLMGALSRSAKGDGATSLHEALKQDHDGRILDDIPRHVRSGDRNDGQKILGHVLGSHQEAAARVLGATSGLDRSQAASLMTTLAPVVLGALGKAQQSKNLGPADLSQMLSGEELDLERQAPNLMHAIWGLLDSDGDGDVDLGDLAGQGARGLGRFLKK